MKLPTRLKYVNQFLSRVKETAGFTMIELLVVISVIGVLAVAVLSSINPIEQINKGRDTRTRSDAAQLINAAERYFATHEYYPWNYAGGTYTPPANLDTPAEFVNAFVFDGTTASTAEWAWTDQLVSTAEVKSGFVNRIRSASERKIFVVKEAGSNGTLYACFRPQSQAFQLDAATKCNTSDPGVLGGAGGLDVCATTNGVSDPNNWICLP